MKVARRWSNDPTTRHNLAQRFRGLRRQKNETHPMRLKAIKQARIKS